MQKCDAFTDASSLFALSELSELVLSNIDVSSIEGIQQMKKLTRLSIAHNKITDITPIGEIDYTYCMQPDEWGNTPHFRLEIESMSKDGIPAEQFSVLSAVPYFEYLDIDWNDYHIWIDAVKNTPIRRAQICDCSWDNEGFRTFIEQHPELEEIDLRWNPKLTDLSPLLNLKNLREVTISNNMRTAQSSLGGEIHFRLQIED